MIRLVLAAVAALALAAGALDAAFKKGPQVRDFVEWHYQYHEQDDLEDTLREYNSAAGTQIDYEDVARFLRE